MASPTHGLRIVELRRRPLFVPSVTSGLLENDIGYIKILGFTGFAPFKSAADQAMADLANTEALIWKILMIAGKEIPTPQLAELPG